MSYSHTPKFQSELDHLHPGPAFRSVCQKKRVFVSGCVRCENMANVNVSVYDRHRRRISYHHTNREWEMAIIHCCLYVSCFFLRFLLVFFFCIQTFLCFARDKTRLTSTSEIFFCFFVVRNWNLLTYIYLLRLPHHFQGSLHYFLLLCCLFYFSRILATNVGRRKMSSIECVTAGNV